MSNALDRLIAGAERAWTVEIRLENITNGVMKTITRENEDAAMILQLAQIDARFIHEGVNYYSGKPTVDPLNRKLTYWCQGYQDT